MLLASLALRLPFQELKDAMIKETDRQRAKGLKQLDLIHISYADDSYYCTSVKVGLFAIRIAPGIFDKYGLKIKMEKSSIYCGKKLVNQLPEDLKINVEGMEILGSVIGNNSFIESFLESKFQSIDP